MLMLSKRVEYGLMALLHIDQVGRSDVVSSKEVADAYDLPGDLIGKVLQSLARSGLIEALHGAKGGYRINRSLAGISLGDVIRAIEGPVHLVKCQHDAADCHRVGTCIVRDPIGRIHIRLQSFMDGISLASLKENPEGVTLER